MNCHRYSFADHRQIGAQIVVQKNDVALPDPIDLGGGDESVIEPEVRRIGFPWWASPSMGVIAAIAVGTLLDQPVEFFFHLAFFPPRRSLTNDEEIRRMQNAKLLSRRALIFKLYGRRLIIKLNH